MKKKNTFGFNIGVMPYWKFSKLLNLRFGVGYNFRNFKNEITGLTFGSNINPQTGFTSTTTVKNKYVFHELQLPLHLIINATQLPIYGFIGTDFNYCFYGTHKRKSEYGDGTNSEDNNDIKPQFNPAVEFGMGAKIPIRSGALNVEVYYSLVSKLYTTTNNSGQSVGLKLLFNSFWK